MTVSFIVPFIETNVSANCDSAFMVLGEAVSDVDGGEGADEDGDTGGGFTIGGDISFYQWDFEAGMPPKDID